MQVLSREKILEVLAEVERSTQAKGLVVMGSMALPLAVERLPLALL